MISFLFLIMVSLDSPRKVYVGVNPTTFESQLLQDELTRNWTEFNPKVEITEKQVAEFKKIGEFYNSIRKELNVNFEFVNISQISDRVECPCLKMGKYGEWIAMDKRAFQNSTFPLLTVIWMYKSYYHLDEEARQKYEFNKSYMKWLDAYNNSFRENNKIMKEHILGYDNFFFIRDENGFVIRIIGYKIDYVDDYLFKKEGIAQIAEPQPIIVPNHIMKKLVVFPRTHKFYSFVPPIPPWE